MQGRLGLLQRVTREVKPSACFKHEADGWFVDFVQFKQQRFGVQLINVVNSAITSLLFSSLTMACKSKLLKSFLATAQASLSNKLQTRYKSRLPKTWKLKGNIMEST
jgi:hypothetical protein